MKWNLAAAVGAAAIMALTASVPVVQADSLSGVVGARAKERQGRYLNRQDREQLRRYGGNGWRSYGYRDYDYGYYGGGPGVSVYIGPGGYAGPYGY